MDSKKPSGNETRVRRTALVVVLALTAAWSSHALSRTQPVADCGPGHDLQVLTAPVDALVMKPVDHVPTEQDVSGLDSIDFDRVSGDTGTPLLNFAPNINDALQGVFEENSDSLLGEKSLEIPVSPIAESEDIPDLSELPEDGAGDGATEEETDIPLLERQMYRIDI